MKEISKVLHFICTKKHSANVVFICKLSFCTLPFAKDIWSLSNTHLNSYFVDKSMQMFSTHIKDFHSPHHQRVSRCAACCCSWARPRAAPPSCRLSPRATPSSSAATGRGTPSCRRCAPSHVTRDTRHVTRDAGGGGDARPRVSRRRGRHSPRPRPLPGRRVRRGGVRGGEGG